jgi:hypothetical protein
MNEPSEIGPRYQTLVVKEAKYSLWLVEQGMSLRGDFGVKQRFRFCFGRSFTVDWCLGIQQKIKGRLWMNGSSVVIRTNEIDMEVIPRSY